MTKMRMEKYGEMMCISRTVWFTAGRFPIGGET